MNIVAVDPGWSTGIVSAEWNQDTYPLDIEKKVQVEGGLKGLIESGYLTNREEEDYLRSDEGQDELTDAIYKAFERYKQEIEAGG